MDDHLQRQAAQSSLTCPKGFREQGSWVWEGKLTCIVQESVRDGREATAKWRFPWNSRLLRAVWLGPEDKRTRKVGGGSEAYL